MSVETALWLVILLPAAGAGVIVLFRKQPNLRETATLCTATLLFLLVLYLVAFPDWNASVTLAKPLPSIGLTLSLEPLGLLFAAIASGLWILTSVYSIGYMRGNNESNQTRFYAYFAISLAATMGIAFSNNLFSLFVFYEVLTLSTYPLVTHKGDSEAKRGGRTYLGMLLTTSIGFFLVAMIWTWHVAGHLDFTPGGILNGKIDPNMLPLLLALFLFGTGKAALMPFHRWLPAAMVAPTPVSALLHAVAVVKAGVFTVVKIIVYIFGLDLLNAAPNTDWLLYVAAATILIASIIALRQDNLKRRLAYSTVSQLSYVIMAAAILAPISVMGAALHIAAHAFGKITLFFAAGSIYTAAHKQQVSQLNGIGRRMPWTMTAFAIGSLSIIGVPPTAGFLSKWYILLGAFEAEQLIAIFVIVASTLLNAAYFLPIVYAAFFRAPDPAGAPAPVAAPIPVDQMAAHGSVGAARIATDESEHGEAPLPIVIALMISAAGTVLMFFLPEIPLELARQLVEVAP